MKICHGVSLGEKPPKLVVGINEGSNVGCGLVPCHITRSLALCPQVQPNLNIFSERNMLECDIGTHIPIKSLGHKGSKWKSKN